MNKKFSAGAWFAIAAAILAIVSFVIYSVNIGSAGYFQNAAVGAMPLTWAAVAALAVAVAVSMVGFKGIAKKVCIFVLVGIANIVDTQVIQNGSAIRTAVIFFYLSNEGLSVLENAAVIGLPIPDKLKAMLVQLADEKKPPEDDDAEADE